MLGLLRDPLLEDAAELGPELQVRLAPVGQHRCQVIEHLARQPGPHLSDVAILLDHLARQIERQVRRVHHALDEAEERRQQRPAAIHDQHAPHVELESVLLVTVIEVERGLRGQEEERLVFQLALRP